MNVLLQHYLGMRAYNEHALKMQEDSRRGVTNYELKDVKDILKNTDLANSVMVMPANPPFLAVIEKDYDGPMDSKTGQKLADQRVKDLEKAISDYGSSSDIELNIEIADVDPTINFQSPYLIQIWVYEKPFKAESKQRVNGRLQTVYNWKTWQAAIDYIDKYYGKWSQNTIKAKKSHWIYYGAQQLLKTHSYFQDNYLDGQYPVNLKDSRYYKNLDNYLDQLKGLGIDEDVDMTDRSAEAPEFLSDTALLSHIQAIADYIGVATKELVEAMNGAMEDPESWKSIKPSSIRRYLGLGV